MSNIVIRRVEREDVDRCTLLEQACYPPVEQATREFIEQRIEVYPDGFYVAEVDGQIVGMINCGATHKDDITNEEFKKLIGHVRNGKNNVIFSLAVHPEYRGEGIARKLLNEIVTISSKKEKKSILLLCKDQLVTFYQHLGFSYSRPSSSSFGGYTWHEMSLPILSQS